MDQTPLVPVFGARELLADTWRTTVRSLVPALPILAVLIAEQLWYTNQVMEAQETGAVAPWRALAVVVLFGATFGTVLHGALLRLALDGLDGRPALGAALRVAVRRYVPFFLAYVAFATATGIGALLCVVPGVFFALSLVMALPIVLDEDAGPVLAIERAWERIAGFRVIAFQASVVVFFASFAVLIAAACLVGAFGLVAGVASGAGVDAQRVGQTAGAFYGTGAVVLILPWLALAAALHRRIRAARAAPPPGEAPIASADASSAAPSP